MKTILKVLAVAATLATLVTPALADPHGRSGGHWRHCGVTRRVAYAAPAYVVGPATYPRVRSGFYFGFSGPGFYASVGAPVFYGPAAIPVAVPVVVAPPVVPVAPVWVPAHYATSRGVRVYVEGYWRR